MILYNKSVEHKPDTSIVKEQNVMTPGWNLKVGSHYISDEPLYNLSTYESVLRDSDTLMVFVYNADSFELYGWEYARENYLVQQRYHLSLDDLYKLHFLLSFPPTEEMRNIKMWPPYGTYDSVGHIIK